MAFAVRDVWPNYGGEPTLGILRDGTILYQGKRKVFRSTDEGRTWVDLKLKPVTDVVTGEGTLDPYLHIDEATERVLSSQLQFRIPPGLGGACQVISISDDAGKTWLDNPTQCGTIDHQKVGSGPWAGAGTHVYPRAVYTCSNRVFDTGCSVSVDGGVTWPPEITVFPGYDPDAEEGIPGTAPGVCGGLEGDPVSGPDGTLYLPREYCGRPYLAVSTDNGLTWELHRVASPALTGPIAYGANNPSVSADASGALFYAWTGTDWHHYVARSTDRGRTWSPAWPVSPPDVPSTTFPLVIARRAGAVATAYIGSRDTDLGPDEAPRTARWYLFVSYSTNASDQTPAWTTVQVTPPADPIMIGCVGRHGPACGNGALLDFNDAALTPDGRLAISYTDACDPYTCYDYLSSTRRDAAFAIQLSGPTFR